VRNPRTVVRHIPPVSSEYGDALFLQVRIQPGVTCGPVGTTDTDLRQADIGAEDNGKQRQEK
jgi:hypothetical protein